MTCGETTNKNLSGKTAIITGASSGIGYQTAFTLAQEGAAVVICARRKDKLDNLAVKIKANSGKVLVVSADVGINADIDSLLSQTLSWQDGGNKYDIVVVNAGRGLTGSLLNSDECEWEKLCRINILGASYLMRQAGLYLSDKKAGDIVVVGSIVGKHISPFSAFYGASKFAVGALAEALRREIGPMGVRVSLVMPGIVESGFQGVAGYNEENFYKDVAQFGKLLEPQAIAEGIRWLLTLPPHVNVNEIMIRPTGQNYP